MREYGGALFKGTEGEFAQWLEGQRVVLYVHSMGELCYLKS